MFGLFKREPEFKEEWLFDTKSATISLSNHGMRLFEIQNYEVTVTKRFNQLAQLYICRRYRVINGFLEIELMDGVTKYISLKNILEYDVRTVKEDQNGSEQREDSKV